MGLGHFSFASWSVRLLATATAVVLLAGGLAAQSVGIGSRGFPEPPVRYNPPPTPQPGLGNRPGVGSRPLDGALQNLPKAPDLRVEPAPPAPAAPEAAKARTVRFSCEVAPYDQSCREAGVPDGGGDDGECNCARDPCYDHYDAAGGYTTRICQKLQ